MNNQVAGIIIHSRVLGVNYFTLLLGNHESEYVRLDAKVTLNSKESFEIGEIADFIYKRKHITVSFTRKNDLVTEVRLNG